MKRVIGDTQKSFLSDSPKDLSKLLTQTFRQGEFQQWLNARHVLANEFTKDTA